MDAQLNPTTQDYTGDRLNNVANAVYLRLMTPLGTWWADAHLGSRLHELEREKDVPRIRRLAVQYSEMALDPLLHDKRAKSITVTEGQPHNGRCNLHVAVEDNKGHNKTFRNHARVG